MNSCPFCGKPVLMVRERTGALIMVDPIPGDTGIKTRGETATADKTFSDLRYQPHILNCPRGVERRKKSGTNGFFSHLRILKSDKA